MRIFVSMMAAMVVVGAAVWSEPGVAADSAFAQGLAKADSFDWSGDYKSEEAAVKALIPSATNDILRADLNWRLARVYLNYGDEAAADGTPEKQVVDLYQQGEAYADQAIKENPNSAEGYFWKSGNLGKVGLLRGVLNSLFMIPTIKDLLTKTVERDPNHHDAFFALAQLYSQAPGWPLSIGNIDHAVSLERRAIDLMESDIAAGKYPNPNYEFYTELANDLHKRNWDQAKRTREQAAELQKYRATSDPLEKNFYYEGTVSIPAMSDRQEARAVLQKTVARIQALANPQASDLRVLKAAQKSLADWK